MRHSLILFAALLLPAAPAVAQVTVDLRALDALPATPSAPAPHRAVPERHAPKPIARPKAAANGSVRPAPAIASARPAAPPPAAKPPETAAPPAATAAAPPPKLPTMNAAPPAVAALTPIQPPAPPARMAPPPAPPIRDDSATRAAATSSGLRVSFPPGKADLSPDSAAAIKQLVGSAPSGGAVTFSIAAYAAGVADDPSVARRLSLSRALAVRTALLADGVTASRIEVRAMGSNVHSGPVDRADVSVLGANDPAR